MPQRRAVVFSLASAFAVAVAPAVALADISVYAKQVEAELRKQGFTKISVGRSWFGRTLIHAQSKTERREIVLNPHTGEILRDYTRPLSGGGGASEDILGSHGGSVGSTGGRSSSGSNGGSSGGSGDHSGSSGGGSSDSGGDGGSDGSSGD